MVVNMLCILDVNRMYYMIQYINVRSKADDMASLVLRMAQKRKIRKPKNKNRVAQEKWSRH